MRPLKLLLVAVGRPSQKSLLHTLRSSGLPYRLTRAADKRAALLACARARFDMLICSQSLPDGSPAELQAVLKGKTAFLTIDTEPKYTAWHAMLAMALDRWQLDLNCQAKAIADQRTARFRRAEASCALALRSGFSHSVDQVLQVLLEALEASRIYLRESPTLGYCPPATLFNADSPGHFVDAMEAHRAHEVPFRRPDGRLMYLGVEDTTRLRTWQASEMALLGNVAQLLKDRFSRQFVTAVPGMMRLSA